MQTVSGFFNTGSMNFVDCEKRNQPAGKVCTDHRDFRLDYDCPHGDRGRQSEATMTGAIRN
jgi:hypothetical protein